LVGVSVRNHKLRKAATNVGFTEWHLGACGVWTGFNGPLDDESGLLFAVPAATDEEIFELAVRIEAIAVSHDVPTEQLPSPFSLIKSAKGASLS
jgi:hypothetical protein